METDSPLSPADAASALQRVRDGRRAAARRVTTPWWYHPLVGLTMASLVGSGSLRPPARGALLGASVVAMTALFWLYRRLTGLWVNAGKVPGTRLAALVVMVTSLAAFALATWLEDARDVRGALAVCGVLLGIGYTVFWRWVERQLVRLWQAAP